MLILNKEFEYRSNFDTLIALGYNHVCIDMNEIKCFGDNEYGQLNHPSSSTNIISLKSYSNHTCTIDLLPILEIKCWGQNADGQIPMESDSYRFIVTGEKHTCAMKGSYYTKCWGSGEFNVNQIPHWMTSYVSQIFMGGQFSCIVRGGILKCLGKNSNRLNQIPDDLEKNVR